MRLSTTRAAIAAAGLTLIAANAELESGQGKVPPLVQESLTGEYSFKFYCASCHGVGAKGDGPVAPALRTRPSDLTTLARRSGGAFPRARIIDTLVGGGTAVPSHGTGDMPVWGPIFRGLDQSDTQVRVRIQNIADYIETLQEPTSASNDLGARLFRAHCATCHGTTARGDGPVASQLRRTPPDLTQYTARNGGVFPSEQVKRIIDGRDVGSHGTTEMPIWGDAFRRSRDGLTEASAEGRIEAITRYLRTIQQRSAE
jgi:mono/diheme cytochrome c family protein